MDRDEEEGGYVEKRQIMKNKMNGWVDDCERSLKEGDTLSFYCFIHEDNDKKIKTGR